MTRKHFVATAAIIARIEDPTVRAEATADAVREFSRASRRFDADRFRTAVDLAAAHASADRILARRVA